MERIKTILKASILMLMLSLSIPAMAQNNFNWYYLTTYSASGTDTYTATIPNVSLADKLVLKINFVNPNTGASTININSLGAKNIYKKGGDAVSAGDLDGIVIITYDGTQFHLLSGSAGGGGSGESELTSSSTSTSGSTITLDMNSASQRMFYGSATFSTPKTITLSNTTGALVFNFIFEVTDVAAVLTMPATFLMTDANFDGTDWSPLLTGKYEMGGSWDGTNWYVKIAGPFN
jgi:hypothetical protein